MRVKACTKQARVKTVGVEQTGVELSGVKLNGYFQTDVILTVVKQGDVL